MNNYYLIAKESASGLMAFTNILTYEQIGLKIGAKTVVPWLIKNTITDILDSDDNYNAKNMTEKYNYKKELQAQLEQKFAENNFDDLKLELKTQSNDQQTKTIIHVSKIEVIKD